MKIKRLECMHFAYGLLLAVTECVCKIDAQGWKEAQFCGRFLIINSAKAKHSLETVVVLDNVRVRQWLNFDWLAASAKKWIKLHSGSTLQTRRNEMEGRPSHPGSGYPVIHACPNPSCCLNSAYHSMTSVTREQK